MIPSLKKQYILVKYRCLIIQKRAQLQFKVGCLLHELSDYFIHHITHLFLFTVDLLLKQTPDILFLFEHTSYILVLVKRERFGRRQQLIG